MCKHDLRFDYILRGIIMDSEFGATIHEMREKYSELVNEPWPLHKYNTVEIVRYMQQINGLVMKESAEGTFFWYIDDIGVDCERNLADSNNAVAIDVDLNNNADSQSMTSSSSVGNERKRHQNAPETVDFPKVLQPKRRKMVSGLAPLLEEHVDKHNQKVVMQSKKHTQTSSMDVENCSDVTKNSDETAKLMRVCNNGFESSTVRSERIRPSKFVRKLFETNFRRDFTFGESNQVNIDSNYSTVNASNILFLGDDFLRPIANKKFLGHDESYLDEMEFCSAGLTIKDALQKVISNRYALKNNYKYVLVNLGAIDILLGRNVTDIQTDYNRLISKLEELKIRPIITTIPKLKANSNNPHKQFINMILLKFNQFILDEYRGKYLTIDFWNELNRQSKQENKHAENYEFFSSSVMVNKKQKLEIWLWSSFAQATIMDSIAKILKL